MFHKAKLKVALTNIHGTGGVHCPPLLLHAGCEVHEVQEQVAFDPRFPTVKSPNPENAEALSLAVALAEREGCDVVVATDPDCDRMGTAVRNRAGRMELLSGNQVGALLADYRLTKFKEFGWIPASGSPRACLIKTFVTTRLQDAIGHGHGIKVINTLTGFKWIASKMRGYEERLTAAMGPGFVYDSLPLRERARLHLQHGSFFVFGTEESYGYLPNDALRDKDGNSACLIFAELCAWVKSKGLTVPEYLDQIFVKYGFYLEGVINLYYEGASGNAKIKRIIDSYRTDPSEGVWGRERGAVPGFRPGDDQGRRRRADSQAGPLCRHALQRLFVRRARQWHGAEDEVLPLREREGRQRGRSAGRQSSGKNGTGPAQGPDRSRCQGPGGDLSRLRPGVQSEEKS